MAKNGKKPASGWSKRDSSSGSFKSEPLPGKPGETVGRSKPPWPISEFPPFRDGDTKDVIRDPKGPRK